MLAELLPAPLPLHYFAEIDSTNAEAMRRLRAGVAGPALLLAGAQTAGRGRHGRAWHSEAGSGIYLSLMRPLPLSAAAGLPAMSLLTALVVYDSMRALWGTLMEEQQLQLKWPNDVLHQRRKLCGILLESGSVASDKSAASDKKGTEETSDTTVVFGIGINLALSEAAREEIAQPVTDLSTVLGTAPAPEPLLAELTARHYEAVTRYLQHGFAPFQQAWNRADRYHQQDIMLQGNGQRLIGRCEGVDTDGALLLRTATGQQRISSGQIFPRGD